MIGAFIDPVFGGMVGAGMRHDHKRMDGCLEVVLETLKLGKDSHGAVFGADIKSLTVQGGLGKAGSIPQAVNILSDNPLPR